MFTSDVTIAGGHFLKSRIFTTINLFALAAGISAALIIYPLITDRSGVNQFSKDDMRLYRTVSQMQNAAIECKNTGVAISLSVKDKQFQN